MSVHFLKGHGIWLSRYENIPFFNIPEPDGHSLSPVLAGFYMFWTMIILLQVISIELIIQFKNLSYLSSSVWLFVLSFLPLTFLNCLVLLRS